MAFQRPADEDTGYASQLLQIIYAWEGDVGKGVPLDLTEVDSAEYALKVKNKNVAGRCFQFLTSAGNPLLRGAGATVYLGQNMEVTAGKTVDGVDISAHAAATTGIHGATATATANTLLIRDAAGRGKVVAPAVSEDIALKSTVDTHAALTSPHSATPNATPSRLIVRDAAGRAKIKGGVDDDDIVQKEQLDDHAGRGGAPVHFSSSAPNINRLVHRDGQGRAQVENPSAAKDIANKQWSEGAFAPITKGVTGGDSHDHAGGDGAQIPLAGHADNSVDDTKVGNRVPQFYRRQGGSATDWTTHGSTNRTPTAVRMQGGSIGLTIALGNSIGEWATLTFPAAFSYPPLLFAQPEEAVIAFYAVEVQSLSGSSVQLRLVIPGTHGGTDTYPVHWLAIGPE